MKIYTKRGDLGETSLFDGASASKASVRVCAYGDVDEINSVIGVVRQELAAHEALRDMDAAFERLQRDLFSLGAILADPRRDTSRASEPWGKQVAFGPEKAAELEALIDRWDAELAPLTNFVLPGGSRPAAALHVARTVARRAERAVVVLLEQGGSTLDALVYLNRLSDLLFVAARLANHRLGVEDVTWQA